MAIRRSSDQWQQLARAVVLDVLADHHAVTTRELEARAADFTWKRPICPTPVQPHLLTNAVHELVTDGSIEYTTVKTRGGADNQGVDVTTLSLTKPNTNKRTVEAIAARKRLLTARHNGWAHRNLIGPPGEEALTTALRNAGVFAAVQPNVTSLFGQELVGEIDCSCVYVDTATDLMPVLVLAEVKNTREWYYSEAVEPDKPLRRLLRKAAALQYNNPTMAIAPLFVVRQAHATLVATGRDDGFMVASVKAQLIKSDSKLTSEALGEVRDELGYGDLLLDVGTTNYHRGIAAKMIPKNATATAARWKARHHNYLDIKDIDFADF